jgi:hypothetical protein
VSPSTAVREGVYSSPEDVPPTILPRRQGSPVDVTWALFCRSYLERPDLFPEPKEWLEQHRADVDMLPPVTGSPVSAERDWPVPVCTSHAVAEILRTYPGMQ